MNQYWHLLDWVPYRSPVAMFLIGLGIGGLIVQLVNVLLAWRAHHVRAGASSFFANVSWDDMMRYVEFPALPRVGATITLDDGDYAYMLKVVNHEWYVERAKAEVHLHCELVRRFKTRGGA